MCKYRTITGKITVEIMELRLKSPYFFHTLYIQHFYLCAVCARVMRLCPSVCVCVCVCGQKTRLFASYSSKISTKTLSAASSPNLSSYEDVFCAGKPCSCKRLIHGYLKLRVLVRALTVLWVCHPTSYINVDVLTQSHMYRTSEPLCIVRVAVMQE